MRNLTEISLGGLDEAVVQAAAEVLDRWGWGGCVVEKVFDDASRPGYTLKTYLPAENDNDLRQIEIGLALLNRIRETQGLAQLPQPAIRSLGETDWAEVWKANYHVLHVGQNVVIKPTWHEYERRADDVVVEIDPGMAFGSGLHPTTRLCLEALETTIHPGVNVLDVGTGSGILAIAAGKLNASRVLALDVDPMAVQVARQNVRLNRLDHVIKVNPGSLPLQPNEPDVSPPAGWDVIVANILADPIIEMTRHFETSLARDGVLIVSGIIDLRAGDVVHQLNRHNLVVVDRREEADWVALVCRTSVED